MISTFLFLSGRQFVNRLRKRARRLREPRYLAGFIIGAAYLYFFAFRGLSGGNQAASSARRTSMVSMLSTHAEQAQFFGAMFLLVLAGLIWVWPGSRRPLAFTRAEVQFLFQAPITRRQLVHYKLLGSQLALLFGTAIATVFLRPSTFLSAWTVSVGLWLVLTATRLHTVAVSFSRLSLAEHGRSGVRRQAIPIAVVVAVLTILAIPIIKDWAVISAFPNAGPVIDEIRRVWSTGAARIVWWPFMTLAGLPVSVTADVFLKALPSVLAIIALNYLWVLRSDAAFEEASAEQAEKVASVRTRRAQPKVRSANTPFALALDGPVEMAILWKNLILVGRYVSLKTLLRLLPMIVVLSVMFSRGGKDSGVGLAGAMTIMCLMGTVMTALLGPQIARNDLRQDLTHLAVIKTWPIRGATLVRGELLAPTVILTVVAWMLIVCAAILGGRFATDDVDALELIANRLSYALTAMLAAPAIIVIQLIVQNGFAVLFPSWIVLGADRARGIDAMGQRLLMTFGSLLALILMLLPALIAGVLAGVAIYFATGATLVFLPVVVAVLVVAGEVFLATEWLGRVLDRTDLTAVDATE